jgi:hypothetical protein
VGIRNGDDPRLFFNYRVAGCALEVCAFDRCKKREFCVGFERFLIVLALICIHQFGFGKFFITLLDAFLTRSSLSRPIL